MPTSTYAGIDSLVHFLDRVQPRSVLDIGVGFGKIGFIVREYLEVMLKERCRKEDWQVVLEGIEVFPEYLQPHQKYLYDRIHVGNAFEVIDGLGQFDVIVLGDVLEHFDKPVAWQMLDKCINHCNWCLFLFLPLGPGWVQGEAHGNPHEEHRSFWQREEIEPFAHQAQYSDFGQIGEYGRFLIRKEDYLHHRMREKAELMYNDGGRKEAIAYLEHSLQYLPRDLQSEYLLVDFQLNDQQYPAAASRLRLIRQWFPEEQGAVEDYLNKLDAVLPPGK